MNGFERFYAEVSGWIETEEEVIVATYPELCANELQLRLNKQMPGFDLSHEHKTLDAPHFIFATIDRPVAGRIDREARALRFDDHTINQINLTTICGI